MTWNSHVLHAAFIFPFNAFHCVIIHVITLLWCFFWCSLHRCKYELFSMHGIRNPECGVSFQVFGSSITGLSRICSFANCTVYRSFQNNWFKECDPLYAVIQSMFSASLQSTVYSLIKFHRIVFQFVHFNFFSYFWILDLVSLLTEQISLEKKTLDIE